FRRANRLFEIGDRPADSTANLLKEITNQHSDKRLVFDDENCWAPGGLPYHFQTIQFGLVLIVCRLAYAATQGEPALETLRPPVKNRVAILLRHAGGNDLHP